MTLQPSRIHRNNPKSQIDHHQNPNRNLHVTLLKTQTQISHASPPQIKTQVGEQAWESAWERSVWYDFLFDFLMKLIRVMEKLEVDYGK